MCCLCHTGLTLTLTCLSMSEFPFLLGHAALYILQDMDDLVLLQEATLVFVTLIEGG